METIAAPSGTSLLFEIVTLTFSGITLVLIVTVAVRLSSLLATIVTKLDFLSGLPDKLNKVEGRLTKLESDVNNLWDTFRSYREDHRGDHKHE